MINRIINSSYRNLRFFNYVSLSPEDYLYNQRMATLVSIP